MDMSQAMRERHTVRRYTKDPIPAELAERLQERIKRTNVEQGVSMRLMLDDPKGVYAAMKMMMAARNVRNYLLLAGPDRADIDERLGYAGSDVMLYAQTLGLNSWWCGGMYNRSEAQKNAPGLYTQGVIVVGYGQDAGMPHKSKAPTDVATYEGEWPQWFSDGVEALLLAPTAKNRQSYTVHGVGNRVSLTCDNGAFSGIDLGIGKHHFELGSGRENFVWA